MTVIWRDRILFSVLFLVGVTWTILSATTIPGGYSGSHISPASFPTALGVLLSALSAIGLASAEMKNRDPARSDIVEPGSLGNEVWGAAATFGFLILYVLAMQYLGFTLATVVSVALFAFTVLGQRSPIVIGALSLTLGVGLYLLMNKLLGVHLPAGVFGLGF